MQIYVVVCLRTTRLPRSNYPPTFCFVFELDFFTGHFLSHWSRWKHMYFNLAWEFYVFWSSTKIWYSYNQMRLNGCICSVPDSITLYLSYRSHQSLFLNIIVVLWVLLLGLCVCEHKTMLVFFVWIISEKFCSPNSRHFLLFGLRIY